MGISVIAAFLARATAALASFLFAVVAARLLGPSDFGLLATTISAINITVVIALMGHETLATRVIGATSELHADAREHPAQVYVEQTTRRIWWVGWLGVLGPVLVIVASNASPDVLPGFLVIALTVPFVAQIRFKQAILRGAHKPVLASLPDGVFRPLIALALMVLLIAGDIGPVTSSAIAAVVAAATSLLLAHYLASRVLQASKYVKNSSHSGTPPQKSQNFSRAIYLSTILAVVSSQLPLFSIGILSGVEDAAYFAAAERVALAAALISQSVYLALGSKVAKHYADGAMSQLSTLVGRCTRAVSLLTVVVCVAVYLLEDSLLTTFGVDFMSAGPVLSILLLGVLGNALAGPVGLILLMTHRERAVQRGLSTSVACQALLIPVILPLYGTVGVSAVVVLSTAVWNLSLLRYMKQQLGLPPCLLML